MTNTLFQPAERPETLGSTVLSQIKELLLSGHLMPGDSLSLRSTATALGVSVMPVREAVNQLVADQALEVTPNRAVRVPVLTSEQFLEVTRIRLEIEGYAVMQAARIMSEQTTADLYALNEKLARAMEQGQNSVSASCDSHDDVVSLNKALHFTVYDASAMPMLVKIIESLWLRIGPILNYDLRTGSERTSNKIAVRHHEKMIQALSKGDALAAKEALHDDILSAYRHIVMKRYGNRGHDVVAQL